MSIEVLEIVEQLNRKELKTQLAIQCAPVLTGIKISNLLILPKEYDESVEQLFRNTKISCYKLYENKNKSTYLLYRRTEVMNYLLKMDHRPFMEEMGYVLDGRGRMSLEEILWLLSAKYAAHMQEETVFPHELGLILGYPIQDVEGFMKNNGKNYRYSGYWKVYGDVPSAVRTFENYERSKEQLIRYVASGAGIMSIMRKNNLVCS